MSDLAATDPTRVPAIRLLDADRDFARAVPPQDRALADRALTLRVLSFAAGTQLDGAEPGVLGHLVLDGALWREVQVGSARAPQLLGAGAVQLPAPAPSELTPVTCRVTALSTVRTAVLDRRFTLAAARWPELTSILHERLAQQERDLGAIAAIGHLPRVDDRLLALLWHLAERWGTVGSGGVRLALHLTHATLGRFVAARRPTVSLALSELREAGRVVRQEDGTWLLCGPPPSATFGDRGTDPGPPDLFPRAPDPR